MVKELLQQARQNKGLTQQQMADALFTDVSNYNRKENGSVKIRPDEWEKLAKALGTSVEKIYESEESHYFVFKENSTGNYLGTNHIYSIPENLIETQKKYILKLEQEIERLKNSANS